MIDVAFLSQIPIFASLAPDDLGRLAELWRPDVCEAGRSLFVKGDPPRMMYLIRDGKVAISVKTDDGEEVVLSLLHTGDFFGELGVLDGSPRTASAKALERVELFEMERADFLDFLRHKPDVTVSLLGAVAQRLRTTDELIERGATRNLNEENEQRLGFGDRTADRLAQLAGSWAFIGGFCGVLILWMAMNSVGLAERRFDPFPFILLNLVLSCVAALQAPVIMMSQNRQSKKDRLQADLDYQVNLKAEVQIQRLHLKFDELRASEIQDICARQQEQLQALERQVGMLREIAAQKPSILAR